MNNINNVKSWISENEVITDELGRVIITSKEIAKTINGATYGFDKMDMTNAPDGCECGCGGAC